MKLVRFFVAVPVTLFLIIVLTIPVTLIFLIEFCNQKLDVSKFVKHHLGVFPIKALLFK